MKDVRQEITDTIYDTIMENVGMSKHHVKFNLDLSSGEWVDGEKGEIRFEYKGKSILVRVMIED